MNTASDLRLQSPSDQRAQTERFLFIFTFYLFISFIFTNNIFYFIAVLKAVVV